jgi:transcriptional regulator with XRE-family HTH domain
MAAYSATVMVKVKSGIIHGLSVRYNHYRRVIINAVTYNAWRKAVKEIRTAAKIPETRVAKVAGFSQPRLHNYLHGARKPSADAVHKINAALARIIDVPFLSQYLYSEYCLDLTGDGNHPAMDFAGVLRALDLVEPYLRDGYKRRFPGDYLTLPPFKRMRLVATLNNVYSKRLVRRLLGKPEPQRRHIDEVLAACREAGVDLDRWLKEEDELAAIEREDAFVRAVRAALGQRVPDARVRFDAEREILNALQELTGGSLHGEGRLIAPPT